MIPHRHVALSGLLLVTTSALGCAGLSITDVQQILEQPGSGEDRVVAGLKEALRVGTDRAVATLSREGGFSDVASLRLRLPEEVQPAAQALRTVGLGRKVDDLEDAMNRAAERAAGEAAPVFGEAILAMTLQDALGILNGADDAATRYFQAQTSEALRARFDPVVEDAMQAVGVYRVYSDALRFYEAIPLSRDLPAPDLRTAVLDSTLRGLFRVLAEEEARIREDPAARTTALLREVFGASRDAGN